MKISTLKKYPETEIEPCARFRAVQSVGRMRKTATYKSLRPLEQLSVLSTYQHKYYSMERTCDLPDVTTPYKQKLLG